MTRTLFMFCLAAFLPHVSLAQSRPTLSAIPQHRAFEHRESIWMGYHEPSGHGSVELRPMVVIESPELVMRTMFSFEGRTLSAPPEQVSIGLESLGPADRFPGTPTLSFILDGSREIAAGELSRQPGPPGGRPTEILSVRIPAGEFVRLASASSVRARVGTEEITFSAEQLEAIRDFMSRMRPETHARLLEVAKAATRVEGYELRKTEFDASEVDTPASIRTARQPRIPAGVVTEERRIPIEYVVDENGRVIVETVRGRFPERDAVFIDAIRRVIGDWDFEPAVKDGQPVRQRMRQEFVVKP